jgi:aspartate/methionine/tyrosine aminotransferase
LTFCLSGLSKVAGLPQMKIGWIVLAGPPAGQAAARERLELIADTYLSVGTPVQHALPRLLTLGATVREQIQERVRENLSWLRAAVRSAPACRVLDVEGGWYAILQVPQTRSEEQWCLELLEQDDVLIQPGFFYDFESEAFLVASLLTSPAVFQEGIRRLLARIGGF